MSDDSVLMYSCGPTVYSYAHIGNARAAVNADLLFRILSHKYSNVEYTRNVTDIDDKIVKKSIEEGLFEKDLSDKYYNIYSEDMISIGCSKPTNEPRATEYVNKSISMIETLIGKGHAYENEGHVFFDVSSHENHGCFSGRQVVDYIGERITEKELSIKRDPRDFVLWKPTDIGKQWWSPFGSGRMGWHIECSTMAKHTLGDTIDIHCGGVDLKFPHHENEIAQSECSNGKKFCNYWVHNEFVNINGNKMAKSDGNIKLVHDMLKDYDGSVIRYALIKTHYRKEIDWNEEILKNSRQVMDKYYRYFLKYQDELIDVGPDNSWLEVLFNDVDVSLYLSLMDNEINKDKTIESVNKVYSHGKFLGLFDTTPSDYFLSRTSFSLNEINSSIDKIKISREDKDYESSDKIRKCLEDNNVHLEISGSDIWWYTR